MLSTIRKIICNGAEIDLRRSRFDDNPSKQELRGGNRLFSRDGALMSQRWTCFSNPSVITRRSDGSHYRYLKEMAAVGQVDFNDGRCDFGAQASVRPIPTDRLHCRHSRLSEPHSNQYSEKQSQQDFPSAELGPNFRV